MSITHELRFVKSTKGSHVYANSTFSAIYIPKMEIRKLTGNDIAPTTLVITITSEKENNNA